VAFQALSQELERTPESGSTWIYWNNALAGMPGIPVLTLGAVIPEGPGSEALVRGLALGQRALNGLGGVRERPIVLVLERPRPDQVGKAARQIAEGRSGRLAEGPAAHGQTVEALLVFGKAGSEARIPRLTVPTYLVGDGLDPAGSGAAGALRDPGLDGAAQALIRLAGKRPLVVFSPELARSLRARSAQVVEPPPADASNSSMLVHRTPQALFILPARDANRPNWESLLRAGGEVVLVADSTRNLPKVDPESSEGLSAAVALSPFHPWRAGATASRLEPATFGPRPPEPGTARGYDALLWLATAVVAEAGEYRGSLLAAGRDGQARPAPYQLFDVGPGGWRYRRTLEAAQP